MLVLLVVALLPFPTRLIAEALTNTSRERVYVTMYGLTLLAIRLGSALDAYVRLCPAVDRPVWVTRGWVRAAGRAGS